MRMKTAVLVTIISTAVATGWMLNAPTAQHESPQQLVAELEDKEKKHGLTIKEHVRLAKARGQRSVLVRKSHANSHYAGFRDFDTAAAAYALVIAQPVAGTSYLHEDNQIHSSYKFRILEVLSDGPPSDYTFKGNLRPELLPLEKDEFVVAMRGGGAVIDGVEVAVKYDEYEPFDLSKKYLLFLNFDAAKKVGGLGMGPLSALAINDDGTLETLDRQAHPIKLAVDVEFGNAVEKLKGYLKNRKKLHQEPALR